MKIYALYYGLLAILVVGYFASKYREDRLGKIRWWQVDKRKFMETRYKGLEHMLGGFKQNGRTQPVEIRVFFLESLVLMEKLIRSTEDSRVILQLIDAVERGHTHEELIDLSQDIIKRFPKEEYSFWHQVRY